VTWLRREGGYELLFNRDELKSRAEALPPRPAETDGVRWIAPVDPDGGGTWLATSERGLTIGVLNGRRVPDDPSREWTTRGRLAPALVSSRDLAALAARLRGRDLARFRPFRLVAITPAEPATVAEWDGAELSVDAGAEGRVPFVSAAIDESVVGAARRAEYTRVVGGDGATLERLLAFHRSAPGGAGPCTVSMERPEAATRSLTHVSVDAEAVIQRYHPGRPDLGARALVVTLARAEERA
jgi:hypothetical protein